MNSDDLFARLAEAASRRDYLAAYAAVKMLHRALDRRCACGKKAMEDGPRCMQCWSSTPDCARMLGRIARQVEGAIAAAERDDLEKSVVATVFAEGDAKELNR